MLSAHDLHQHVTGPTHYKNYTLDLIITRSKDNCVASTAVEDRLSGHYPVRCSLMCARPPPQKKTIRYRKLMGLNPEVLKKAVTETSLCSKPANGLEALVTQYQEDLNKVLDSVAPVQTKFVVGRPLVPWINNDILNCKGHKQKKGGKLWQKKKLTVYYDMYVAEKQKLQNMIKVPKTDHCKGEIREFSVTKDRYFDL